MLAIRRRTFLRPPRERAVVAASVIVIVAGLVGSSIVLPSLLPGLDSAFGDFGSRPAEGTTGWRDGRAITVGDGLVPDDYTVTIDSRLPAVTKLDPVLADALRRASTAASADDVTLAISSGWRSMRYQQQLFDEAQAEYGDEVSASELVAPADLSSHVTGDAVDIGPLEAQFWLIEHGSDFGLCQMFANERWHFELATIPGDSCPDMLPNASYLRG